MVHCKIEGQAIQSSAATPHVEEITVDEKKGGTNYVTRSSTVPGFTLDSRLYLLRERERISWILKYQRRRMDWAYFGSSVKESPKHDFLLKWNRTKGK